MKKLIELLVKIFVILLLSDILGIVITGLMCTFSLKFKYLYDFFITLLIFLIGIFLIIIIFIIAYFVIWG
jgi:hypothetical protein